MERSLRQHIVKGILALVLFHSTNAMADDPFVQSLLQTRSPDEPILGANSARFLSSAFDAGYLSNLAKNAGTLNCSPSIGASFGCATTSGSAEVTSTSLKRDALSRIQNKMANDALRFSPTLSALASGKIEFDLSMGRLLNSNEEEVRPVYQLAKQSGDGERKIVAVWTSAKPASEKAGESAENKLPRPRPRITSNLERDHFSAMKLRLTRTAGALPTASNTALRLENSSGLLFAELPNMTSTSPNDLKTGVSVTWNKRAFIFSSTNSGKSTSLTFSNTSTLGSTANLIFLNAWNELQKSYTSSMNLAFSVPM
jgi:hypothetical protein